MDKQISRIKCQTCKKAGQSLLMQTQNYYFVGGDDQLTVLDTQFEAVIARIEFEGCTKGLCVSRDGKNVFLQADNKIYQWKVGINDLDEIEELKNSKKLFKSPTDSTKLYSGLSDKTFKEVIYNSAGSWKTTRQLRCKEQVTKIAINDDDTIAYVCCGAQNLYRIELEEFKISDDMVDNLTGVCHDLMI